MTVSAPDRPKIPNYVGHDEEGETSNHIIMAKTKNKKKQMGENIKSPKKKNSVRYPFSFVEKIAKLSKSKNLQFSTFLATSRKFKENLIG